MSEDKDISARKEIAELMENYLSQWKFIKNYMWLGGVLTTFILGMMFIVRLGYYIYSWAFLNYWEIDKITIYNLDYDIIFNIIFNVAIAIFIVIMNVFPYNVLTNGNKKRDRIYNFLKWGGKWYGIIFLILLVLLIVIGVIEFGSLEFFRIVCTKKEIASSLFLLTKTSLLLFFVLFSLGISFGISFGLFAKSDQNYKKNVNNTKTFQNIKLIIITLAIELMLVYVCGLYFASSEEQFKIMNDDEIVIYENADIMIVSQIVEDKQIEGEKIAIVNNKVQKIIDKKGAMTETVRFDKVKKVR